MNGPNRLASKKAAGHYRFPVALLLLGPLLAGSAQADVKLPAIFGDHMVLQRDLPVAVRGWADPGETVTVRAGSSAANAAAGADGKWMVKLGPLSASDQPIEVTVSGKNTVHFTDVLVGDVWICAGQSNMGFPLNGVSNAATELPQAKHPRIRLFNVDTKMSFEPLADCTGKWTPCTPGTAQNFSAVGYFFGRDLHQILNVPIGLVETSLGGTSAQAWTSLPGLRADPATRPLADEFEKTKPDLVARMEKYEKETVPRWQQEHELWRKEVNPSYQDALRRWNETVRQAQRFCGGRSRPEFRLGPGPNRRRVGRRLERSRTATGGGSLRLGRQSGSKSLQSPRPAGRTVSHRQLAAEAREKIVADFTLERLLY